MKKVVLLEPLGIPGSELVAMVKDAVAGRAEVVYYDSRKEDIPTLIERSRDADAVVLSNFRYPGEVMAACPHLEYVNVAFTGYDHVDMAYCREKGIKVSNCAGYSTSAVADLVFGMVISLCRRIIECDKAVRSGGTKAGLVGPEMEGLTFGVIGTGAIGSRVAAIAQAFGCNVIAYSRTKKDLPGVSYMSLDEVMAKSDIISLHVPQNAETTGMISAEKIGLMKKSAILINCARGPIVDAEALAQALNSGAIAGAGIDVFAAEPPLDPDDPLLHAKNTVCTPHVAFASTQAMYKRAKIVCDNLKGWLDGEMKNLV